MKYLLIGLLLVFPFVSSAATLTPAQRQTILNEIQVLENELEALLANQSPETNITQPITTSSPDPLGISIVNMQSYPTIGGLHYGYSINVTNNTSSAMYVPTDITYIGANSSTNIPGFSYSINAQSGTYQGSETATVSCAPTTLIEESTGYVQVCTIPANTSVPIDVTVTLSPAINGDYSVTLNNLNYAPDAGTVPSIWTVFPINNKSNSIVDNSAIPDNQYAPLGG